MALCDPCYDLIRDDEVHRYLRTRSALTFRDWLSSDEGSKIKLPTQLPGDIHVSWDSFCDSLDRHCPICWVSWHHIRDSPTASYRDQVHQTFCLWFYNGYYESGSCEYVVLKLQCSLKIQDSDDITVKYFRTTKQQFEDKVSGTPIEDHTGSKTTLNTVKSWLSNCDGGHSRNHSCVAERRALVDSMVPTRLIDVRSQNCQTWSLVETKKHRSFSKYIAVSHRWKEDTPRLLKDNYVSFQTGQHDTTLPRNYQNVFVLCRKLDIQYVWIDSLCIFQDPVVNDFLQEAATMTEVYANAFCTFSICWECPSGFLRPRDTRVIPRNGPFTEDPLKWSDRYVFVQDQRELYMAIGHAPVNGRAWVLQEQLLSSRILYLGYDQLYWECDQGLLRETEPDCFHLHNDDYFREKVVVDERYKLQAWHDLVEEYMRRDLSVERDRLLAISGLVKFQLGLGKNSLHDGSYSDPNRKNERKSGQALEYFAGLQRSHWIPDLLWYPAFGGGMTLQVVLKYNQEPGPESFKRCPDKIVPSWSWAACPGPIQWAVTDGDLSTGESPNYDGGPLAYLRKCHFEPLGDDIYGLPKSASLDISCLLIHAEYTEPNSPEYVHKLLRNYYGYASNEHFDWPTHGFLLPLPYPRVHQDKLSFITIPVEPCDSFITTCFVMPLLEIRCDNHARVVGLIVQEIPQASSNTREFVRIGSFTRYHCLDDVGYENSCENREGMGVINSLLKNLPTDGDEFEQKLRECAQWWKDQEGLVMESEDDVTLKAEWTTIRLV